MTEPTSPGAPVRVPRLDPAPSQRDLPPASDRDSRPPDPSPGVRALQNFRELVTDSLGIVAFAYLVKISAISGHVAVLAMLGLLLPARTLRELAQVAAARAGGAGVAVTLLGAAAAYGQIKSLLGTAAVAGALLTGAALLPGCPMPAPDGCTPRDVRCHGGAPQICSPGQRWTPADVVCSNVGAVCVVRDGVPACLGSAE